jgi:hypothetical protein
MNNFYERFVNYSNSQLLEILDKSTDYQPLAVETAKEILENRNLSKEEVQIAREEFDNQVKLNEVKNRKKEIIENKVKDFGKEVINTIHPIQTNVISVNRTILMVSIVLGILSLSKFYQEFEFIKFMLASSESEWDASIILYFFPLVILPLGTILFWIRKKTGWILLAIYLTFIALAAIFRFIYIQTTEPSGFSPLDDLTSNNSILKHLWSLFLNVGLLWVILKENIRKIYNIEKITVIISIGIPVVLSAIIIIGTLTL